MALICALLQRVHVLPQSTDSTCCNKAQSVAIATKYRRFAAALASDTRSLLLQQRRNQEAGSFEHEMQLLMQMRKSMNTLYLLHAVLPTCKQ